MQLLEGELEVTGVSEVASGNSELSCAACGHRIHRVAREGFLQEKVFPSLGYFPWECPICRTIKLYRNRGPRMRKRRSQR